MVTDIRVEPKREIFHKGIRDYTYCGRGLVNSILFEQGD